MTHGVPLPRTPQPETGHTAFSHSLSHLLFPVPTWVRAEFCARPCGSDGGRGCGAPTGSRQAQSWGETSCPQSSAEDRQTEVPPPSLPSALRLDDRMTRSGVGSRKVLPPVVGKKPGSQAVGSVGAKAQKGQSSQGQGRVEGVTMRVRKDGKWDGKTGQSMATKSRLRSSSLSP